MIRPESIAARMSLSESSTGRPYRRPGPTRQGANMSQFRPAGVVQWQNISFPS